MYKSVEQVQAEFAQEIQSVRKALNDAERNAQRLGDKVAEALSCVEFAEELDDDDLDAARETIADLASSLGLEWEDAYGWEPGETIEFWVPSTC